MQARLTRNANKICIWGVNLWVAFYTCQPNTSKLYVRSVSGKQPISSSLHHQI
jgi:hypothetical protein